MRRARGFTLLEVMLAFVILAVAMGLLLSMLSRGLGQVRQSQEETEATLHAQSLLDQLGVLEPIKAGESDGELGGGRYRYRLEIAETEDPVPAPAMAAAVPVDPALALTTPKLYRVDLAVSWGDRDRPRRLRFVTLRARTPVLDGMSQ
jgi:general secretion pathway protein I